MKRIPVSDEVKAAFSKVTGLRTTIVHLAESLGEAERVAWDLVKTEHPLLRSPVKYDHLSAEILASDDAALEGGG